MKDKFIWCLLILIIIGVIGFWFWMDYINKKDITNISDISEDSTTNKVSTTTSDDIDWSSYENYDITLNGDVNITKAGIYNISGSLNSGNITVDTSDNVKIILNGVNIKTTTAGINIINAKNTYIEIVGDNTIEVTTDDELDAAIYSKDDLVIYGSGVLTIKSNKNGIKSSDNLTILSGTYNITSSEDSIKGKDSLAINGGEFTLNSGDDGMHSDRLLEINGGTFNITSAEGLEATYVKINDGKINISASDDGINATNKSDEYDVTVEINGGDITINMGQGDTDAIDSNGNLYINGGKLTINAQFPFDYDGEAKYSGGTMIVNGSETTEITNQMMGGGQMGPGQGGQANSNQGGQPNGQNRTR